MNLVSNTGEVISDTDLKAMYPYVSFAVNLRQVDVEPYGYNIIAPAAMPAALDFYNITEGAPVQVNGVWTQTWVQTPIELATAQSMKALAMDNACANAIVSGFVSSALGSPYTYPSKMTDQQNLTASVLASLMPNLGANWTTAFWCADANGNWAWRDHTAAQIQQVGADGKVAILALQTKNAGLQGQIKAATNVDALRAIAW